jgi:hypothetical protein
MPAFLKRFHEMFGLARIFHAPEVFIGQAFRDEAVVSYREPLITQPMGTSESALRVRSFLHFIG